MAPITIGNAIAGAEARQGGPARSFGLLALTCLSALLAVSAYAQPATAASPWTRAVDAYLAGNPEAVTATLRGLAPSDVQRQAREVIEAWAAAASGPKATEERRLAIRRVQASAALPLEIVTAMSTRGRVGSSMNSYQDIAIDAWERLAAFEERPLEGPGSSGPAIREDERARLQHFRTWWRIGVLQYLVNIGRYRDFARQADQVRLPEADQAMRAELHFLRGMVREHASRSVPGSEQSRATDRGMPSSRLRGAALAQDDAAREYGRALDAVATHVEARLHLGRVHLERKRPDDAIATLAPLLTPTCAATPCALAALFTGEAHEARGEFDRAGAAYARASSRHDVRQSALVALMQLAVRRGSARSGADLLGQFTDGAPLSRRDGPDAWSTYLGGRRQDIAAVLGPLREALLP